MEAMGAIDLIKRITNHIDTVLTPVRIEVIAKVAAVLVFGGFLVYKAMAAYRLVIVAIHTGTGMNWQRLVLLLSSILYLSMVVFVYVIRPRATLKTRGILPRVLGFAGGFGIPLVLMWLKPAMPSWAMVAGPILLITGNVFAAFALSFLGRGFSILAEARVLVTSGPYAIVRHPLYLAEEISILGLIIMWGTIPAYTLLIVHFIIQVMRMRYEEKVLTKAFPEYGAYRSRTRAFIPWIL